ncbi:FAD-dependent oxidoreductase [Anaerosacchariphilus sp. NSJ-68]|uniref:FAD-dependent oxidoreductase n=2 Tax=Lachnospiraceae TaxID=186803 RepID=A0A923LAI3_9FIRM|nr:MULTISPECIES: FAD-dependent oxidoreductase [Lachnospiraceae]MBC5658986.1 FAD-dependent oxidoreductase [Anaerosacchariphilus hominis]MBC5698745.1 FAD-dependent oxidoreductase [Roseburia difficilis]
MEKYNQWPANHKNDKAPSEKIIALGRKITDVAGHIMGGVKVEDPEYWGLAEIITEEMAEVGLSMKKRVPYTFSEMCHLNKIPKEGEEKFQKLLDEMSYIGLLEYDYGYHYDHNGRTREQTERRYILPMFVPGSAELFNMEELPDGSNPRLKDHPDVAAFFERMTFIPLAGITQMVPPGGAGIGMHVIPVEKAISMENQSMDIEHLSYWLKKYEGHIGVGRCSCRASRKVIGEGVADDDFGWCIGVGDFADYCRETGKGHDITYEEAMAILKRAEDNGFVHQITNIDGENKIFGICNCNVNICNALRTSQLFNTPNMSRSAYVAHVDKDKCVACGRCVEYCPAGATRLGQKLCQKDGTEVKYPKQQLPDAVKWGKDKWDPDYRDNNRINSHKSGTAPCKTACPAHIAVQGYLKKASQGKYQEALALIKKQNPFPAVCGRICNRRCEDACTRGTIDQAVAIDAVKKFIADQDLKAETRYIPPVVIPASIHMEHFPEKIAIIGGGPAGMSAAFYLAEKGYRPTVFEKNEEPGGMLRYGIPSYKLEKDVIAAEIDVMREMGVEIKTGVEVGKDVTLKELREQGYKAFYIAIGCSAGRRPGVPGDDAEGTTTAIDYLREANTGKTSYTGRVVVVGGGNVAIDAARVSARSGAGEVHMLCLESEAEMPAADEEVREANEDGVKIQNGWGPKEVLTENGKVTGIIFKKCTSVKNAEGRFAPTYDENETIRIECDRVIFAVGQRSVWGNMLEGENVTFNGPAIVADKLTYQTGQPDIFVGGDVYTGPKFAIDAIAAGHYAAESLHRYVHNGHMTIGRNRWEFNELDKNNISVESYDNSSRQIEGMDETVPSKSFKDAHLTLTEEQVRRETARCLGCGATIVDENKCIGCGVCTTKCEFDAITLRRDHPECSKMVKAEDKFKHILPYQMKRAVKIVTHKEK